MKINDPAAVREQYAAEDGLAARKSVYRNASGPDAREAAVEAVLEVGPSRVLEVGCGEGELAERLTAEVADLVAIDQSPRMVELTSARGVEAHVADVEELPFPDASFDAVLAAWMLYHVADIDRGLHEIARVLRPGGRLVAATNANDHLEELLALGGIGHWDLPFHADNGAEILGRHFAAVERRDAFGAVTFDDIETVRAYLGSSKHLACGLNVLPEGLDEPIVARRRPSVFVATRHESPR